MQNKMREIINKEFDSRACGMVVGYILDKGMDYISEITDDDIAEIEGNGLMTTEFAQKLVEISRKVVRECKLEDILDYIQTELNPKNRAKRIDLYESDFNDYSWDEIVDELDLEDEDVKEIHGLIIMEDN